jgi:fimbrial chaperone protein
MASAPLYYVVSSLTDTGKTMVTRDFSSRYAALQILLRNKGKYSTFMLLSMLLLVTQSLTTQPAFAASQLLVSPTRIVFEDRMRTAKVTIANTGDTTGRYRISFVQKQMTEAGNLVDIKGDVPGMYSDSMVRFSPREVTLPPGQAQVIRLMLRKKSGLESGEYRSHMLFQALPDPAATSIQKLTDKGSDKLQIQLIPVVGITIPIIVRHGKLNASATISNLQFHPADKTTTQPSLTLAIRREGNRSLYGDFKVTFTPSDGVPVVVGQVNGIAVYTPNSLRNLNLQLQSPPDVTLKHGELHVTYLEQGKDAANGLIAEERLRLP